MDSQQLWAALSDPITSWWDDSRTYIQGPHKAFPANTPVSMFAGLPLFLNAKGFNQIGALQLTIWGTSGNGFMRGLPLVTYAGPDGNVQTTGMALYLDTGLSGNNLTNVNLVVTGGKYSAARSLTLFLENWGTIGSTTMFVFADGGPYGIPGAIPYVSNMNLFLRRMPAEGISLVVNGPGAPTSGGCSLFVSPNNSLTDSVTLSMPKTNDVLSGDFTIFTRGF